MDAINEKKNKFQDFVKKQERSKELIQASIDGNREEVELQHAINDAVAIHGEANRQQDLYTWDEATTSWVKQ